MAGAVIQDVSVNIGATTVEYETAIKRVLVGNQEIQNKLAETAAKSKKYADEQARANKRIEDAEQAKVAAIRAGETAVATAQDKATAASQRAVQSARDEAATRAKLAAAIASDENKASVAAINRIAKARAGIDASLAREQAAAAKSIQLEQEVADAKIRLAQLPLEHDQRIARTREAEAERLANTLIAIENRLAGLYLRNQATLSAAAAKEEAERVAAARAAQREADLKEKAANDIAAAAEREAARVAAAKAKEAAAAEAAAAEEAAAARRAAEAQVLAAKQAANSRRFMVQNAAFQVGDVFTQVAAGTSFTRAAAIQLPQLLGGLGVAGAVAGAVAAALAPLATKLIETKEEAEDAGKATEFLGEALDGLRSTNDAALTSLEDLRKKYGELSDEVIRNLELQQKASLYRVQTQHDSVLAGAVAPLGDTQALVDQIDEIRRLKAEGDKLIADMAAGIQIPLGALDTNTQAKQAIAGVMNQLDRLRSDFGLTENAALSLAQRISDLGKATPSDSVRIANEIRQQLMDAAGSYDAMTDSARTLYDSMGDVASSGAEVTAEVRRADEATRALSNSAQGISSGIDNATASARGLTSELVRAHAALTSLRLAQVDDAARLQVESETVGKPVERAGRLAGLEADAKSKPILDSLGAGVDPGLQAGVRTELAKTRAEVVAGAEANEKLRISIQEREAAFQKSMQKGGGGGGGRKGGGAASKEERAQERAEQQQLNDALRDAGQIYDSTRTEAEKYREELAKIQRLQGMGLLGLDDATREQLSGMSEVERAAVIAANAGNNAEVAKRAIEALNQEYSQLGDVASTVKDGARETFGAIVTGAGNAQGALANLANRLSSLFADKAFDSIWGAISGSISGGAGGGLGKILSFIPGFATGTDSAPGGLALVGERGPELVNLARGSQVITADRTRQIMSGGTSKSQAEVIIRAAEGVTVEQVRQIAGDVSVRITSQAAAAQSRALGSQLQETQRRGTK